MSPSDDAHMVGGPQCDKVSPILPAALPFRSILSHAVKSSPPSARMSEREDSTRVFLKRFYYIKTSPTDQPQRTDTAFPCFSGCEQAIIDCRFGVLSITNYIPIKVLSKERSPIQLSMSQSSSSKSRLEPWTKRHNNIL